MNEMPQRIVRPFTPSLLNDQEFKVYEPELKEVFRVDGITNVAISGPFGAGKTSVMSTWEASKEGSSHKYLHLSLANFKSSDFANDDKGVAEGDIEKMLLNQLVHKVKPWRVPKSRFKTTASGRWSVVAPTAVALIAVGLLALGLAELDWFRAQLAQGFEVSYVSLFLPWIVPAAIFVSFLALRSPFKGLVKRVNLGGNEIELFDEKSSAFNRYMDDILYLLNSSGCDVVVIEDLDRFERLDVFEGLREINILLNSKRRRGLLVTLRKRGGVWAKLLKFRRRADEPIRFFYLVRDDMFTSADRTKFFDLIIPVIPFMDRSNAADVLVLRLAEAGITIDLSFANELSLYLNDPRVLDDVVNNAGHVKAALFDGDGEELKDGDAERIVAMSVYKALFPGDYADLQAGKGCVKYYLDKRREVVDVRRAEISEEVVKLRQRLESITAQGKYNADELSLLYMTESSYDDVANRGPYYGRPDLLRMSPTERVESIRADNGMSSRFDELVGELTAKDPVFAARHKEALRAPDRESKAISGRISELEEEFAELSRTSFSELAASLGQVGRENLFAFPAEGEYPKGQEGTFARMALVRKSQNFGMIEYLLCSGCINDSYERYMSNFYPTSVSSADREVLRQIVQHSPTDPMYEFDRPGASARKLSVDRFAQANARIFSLCHELLADESLGSRRDRFFESASRDGDYRFAFLYVASRYGDAETLRSLEAAWPGSIAESISKFGEDEGNARIVCQKILVSAPDLLAGESLRASIRDFASSDARFLHPRIPIEGSMGRQLERIGYSAESLDIEGSHEETLAEVYSRGLFEPDASLVFNLMKSQHPSYEALEGAQLSNELAAHGDWPARKKADARPVEYLESAIAEFGVLEDSEESVAWLANKPEVLAQDGLIDRYAAVLKGATILDAGVIKDGDALETLALKGKVARTGRNILTIYAANGNVVTESVTRLVNGGDVPDDLTFDNEDGIVEDADFLLDLGRSEGVGEKAFSNVASGYGEVYDDLSAEDLPLGAAKALAAAGCVGMTSENLSLYARCYHPALVDLAASDVGGYVELVLDEDEPTCEFDEEVARSLMYDADPSPSLVRLVGGFESPQKIDPNHYPEDVNAAIIERCFDESDLGVLGETYEFATTEVLKGAVEQKCTELIDSIIREEVDLPMELRLKLLSNPDIDERRKERIVAIGCGSYSVEDYGIMFSAAGMEGYRLALLGKGRYFVDGNDDAESILLDLERMGLISSFKSDGEGRYRVHATRRNK